MPQRLVEVREVEEGEGLSALFPVSLDVVDEAIGTAVVAAGWLVSMQLRLDYLRQLLAQLNTTRNNSHT